jgi:hypothetical protein
VNAEEVAPEGRSVWGEHRAFKPAKSVAFAKSEAVSPVNPKPDDDEEVEEPTINLVSCIILLIVVTVIVGVTAEWYVQLAWLNVRELIPSSSF